MGTGKDTPEWGKNQTCSDPIELLAAGLFKATADFLNGDKAKYLDDLRRQKEQYVDKALKLYRRRIKPFLVGFRILGVLVILGSVSLPFLVQRL